jgi:hypothetical protein
MVDHPTIHVIAANPTEGLHEPWCEVVLSLQLNDNTTADVQLTREGAELTIEHLHALIHPYAGRSVSQILFQKLVELTRKLLAEPNDQDAARAQAIAWCVAVLRNPYQPMSIYESVKDDAMEAAETAE